MLKISVYFNRKWNTFDFDDFGEKSFDELIGFDGTVQDIESDDSTLTVLIRSVETTYDLYEVLKVLNQLYSKYQYLFQSESEFFDSVYVLLKNEYYGIKDLIGKSKDLVKYLEEYFENGVFVEPVKGRTPERVLGEFVFDEIVETYHYDELIDMIEPYIDMREFVDTLFSDFQDELIENGYIDIQSIEKKDYDEMFNSLMEYFNEVGVVMEKEDLVSFVNVEELGKDILYSGDSYLINDEPTPNGNYVIWRVI